MSLPRQQGQTTLFRKDGDYWSIAFGGRTCRLLDTKGLQYLAQLLRHPGREFHATELVGLTGGAARGELRNTVAPYAGRRIAADLGDAGPLLDLQATTEYQRRLADLRDDLQEAESLNDLGRASTAREEIEFLTAELVAAARGRRAASHAERARVTVTKGIKSALAKLREAHPALAEHLTATVKRGYFCSYTPDPRHPIAWLG